MKLRELLSKYKSFWNAVPDNLSLVEMCEQNEPIVFYVKDKRYEVIPRISSTYRCAPMRNVYVTWLSRIKEAQAASELRN